MGLWANGPHMVPCACALDRIRRAKLQKLWAASKMPDGLEGKTFDTFDRNRAPGPFDAVRLWSERMAAGDRPGGLVLFSRGKGTGKTHLAAAAANHLLASVDLLFVDTPTLFGRIFGRRKEEPGDTERMIEALCVAGLLVLDDVGADTGFGAMKQARQEIYFRITTTREQGGLPILATSNLTNVGEFTEVLGERAASRLLGMAGVEGFIDFDGISDYRLRGFMA